MADAWACTSNEILYNDYILPILNASAAITTIPFIILYIRARYNKKLKSTFCLFGLGLAMFVIIFTWFVSEVFHNGIICYEDYQYLSNFFDMANGILYTTQNTLLLLILFIRLMQIFQKTEFALSYCVINSFIFLIVIAAIISSLCSISYNLLEQYSPNSPWLTAIIFIWIFPSLVYILSVIWLNGLFIHKMYKVYHMTEIRNNSKRKMEDIISKTTVLCVVSSMSSLLFFISWFLWSAVDTPDVVFVSEVMMVVDLYTNFLSVLLSFSHFGSYYWKVCGCCDKLGRKYIGGQTQDVPDKYYAMKEFVSTSQTLTSV